MKTKPASAADTAAAAPLPTKLSVGDADAQRIRIVDAETGKAITHVLSVDTEKGTLSRYAVEKGNLVRKDDRFVVIDEERAVRLEWIDA